MIGVGISNVGPNYFVPPLALEALDNVLLGEHPQCLARRHAEQQVVFIVTRYWRTVFSLLWHLPVE